MSEATTPPSQLEVNRTVRVLQGVRMKYTCRLLLKTGEEIEFQLDEQPNLAYDSNAREVILQYDAGGHGYTALVSWSNVAVFRCEKNP